MGDVSTLPNGLTVVYDEVGTGLPFVLLHGFPHNRSLWAPQTSALLEHGRCIAPDLRGFGESGRQGPYSMEQYAEDVIELLATLGIDRAVVGGLSMGGYVAFAIWRAKPQLVRALVLADTRPGADSPDARRKRMELIALAKASGAGAVANAQISGMVGATTRAQNPALVDGLHQMLAGAPVEGVIGAHAPSGTGYERRRDEGDRCPRSERSGIPIALVARAHTRGHIRARPAKRPRRSASAAGGRAGGRL